MLHNSTQCRQCMCTDHTLDVSVCLSVCLSHHESRVTPETVLHLSVLVWGYGLVPGQPLLQDVNTEHSLPTELNVLLFLITTECVLVLLVPHLLLLQLRCLLTHMREPPEISFLRLLMATVYVVLSKHRCVKYDVFTGCIYSPDI